MHHPNRQSLIPPLLIGTAFGLLADPAIAQQAERRDSVTQRSRPGLDANGLPIGAMLLFPELGLELRRIDNIFADDDVKESDTATRVTPELRLVSVSQRHRTEIGGNADIARYADFDSEDFEDSRFWAFGGLQLGDGEFDAELRLSNLHEDRTSPDDIRGTELTEFHRNSVYLGYTHRPGRILVRLDGSYRDLDFSDTPIPGGSVNNDDRDRNTTDLGLRLGYEVSADYGVFIEGRTDTTDYDLDIDRDGFQRSSDGLELRLGAVLALSGVTAGEFYAGYLERDYDDDRFGTASGLSFGGEIVWDVTGLTTLTFGAERTIDSTTIVGAAGITRSSLRFRVDHELLRNLILDATLQLGRDEFEGIARDDDLIDLQLGGKYLMNRYARIEFGYQYRDRDVSPAASGGRVYEISDVSVRVIGQL